MIVLSQDAWMCDVDSIGTPALGGGDGKNVLPMIHVNDLCSVSIIASYCCCKLFAVLLMCYLPIERPGL